MKITIIIPLYNAQEHIVRCLASVAEQSIPGTVECIIINDCSSDASLQRVRDFLCTYAGDVDFRLILLDKNQGVASARNTGLECATGDYIMFLDSDDYLLPNCLLYMSAPILSYPFEMVMAGYQDDVCDSHNIQLEVGSHWSNLEIWDYYSGPSCIMTAWSKLYNRSFLRKINVLFNNSLTVWEDVLWNLQLANKLNNYYVIDEPLYHYSNNASSLTHSVSNTELLNAKIQSSIVVNDYICNELSVDNKYCMRLLIKIVNDILEQVNSVSDIRAKACLFKLVLKNNRKSCKRFCKEMSFRQKVRNLYFIIPYPLSFFYWETIETISPILERIRSK